MDKEKILELFEKHPKLETFIGAGLISLKMAREILGVDRYYMYSEIFLVLVTSGAVNGCSANTFRATPELKEFLRERREIEEQNEQAN